MNFYLKLTIISIFFIPLSFFTITNAQIPSSIDGIEIRMNPQNPSPEEKVNIDMESFNTDLSGASMVWLVDGKNYAQGTGLRSINISAPKLGKVTSVVVITKTVEGREVRKSVTIKSGGVDIIWESSGYTPPLYKGKSLFVYENTIKITAIPHLAGASGKEIDPKTLIYKWIENDKVLQDQSGYGKQSINIKEQIPRPISLRVEVSTRDSSEKAIAFVSIEPNDPSVSFYEEDPLYGVYYNKMLIDRAFIRNQEMSILAVPYSFSTYKRNSPIQYTWSINNLEQPDLSTNQSITLRAKGDTDGSSIVSLEVRNTSDILQGAKNAINVFFNKKTIEENSTFQ